MPMGDRTGPAGRGPMTGRGLGYCSGSDTPGYTKSGRGRNRGRRSRRRRQLIQDNGFYHNVSNVNTF